MFALALALSCGSRRATDACDDPMALVTETIHLRVEREPVGVYRFARSARMVTTERCVYGRDAGVLRDEIASAVREWMMRAGVDGRDDVASPHRGCRGELE